MYQKEKNNEFPRKGVRLSKLLSSDWECIYLGAYHYKETSQKGIGALFIPMFALGGDTFCVDCIID